MGAVEEFMTEELVTRSLTKGVVVNFQLLVFICIHKARSYRMGHPPALVLGAAATRCLAETRAELTHSQTT